MYAFTLGTDSPDAPVLTTHTAPMHRLSCGPSPLATLAELQAYASHYPYEGMRFMVIDLVDVFDAVVIITGEEGTPVDPDEDVSLRLIGAEGFSVEDGAPLIDVGGYTWDQVPALVGERVAPALIRTTAGAVRTYCDDVARSLGMGDDAEDHYRLVMDAFDISERTRDAETVSALARDLDGVVLA